MGFSLAQVKKTRSDIPERITILGAQKVGKSTFGSCAPAPIFIPTEDGLENIDADAFPLCKSWNDVMSAVAALYSDKHDFKTVVLDSADWAERLLHKHVVDAENKPDKIKSIEDFGYGKGYVFAADHFAQLLEGLNALRIERGMRVIVLCHTEIRRFDDPLSAGYDRYQIKLHKQAGKLLQEWSDVIGFAQLESFTRTEKKNDFAKTERALAATSGRRVLHLAGSPAFDAGNRYGLPERIDFSWSAYADAITAARK
jgi:hypothetical protein